MSKLIKRSRKPKGKYAIVSMNDHGHWFWVINGGDPWTCNTCGKRFNSYPYDHKCPKDPNAQPRKMKRIYENGVLVGGTEFQSPSRLVQRK